MIQEQLILDACCGSRMMWFDKTNPSVTYADIRKESHILCDGRTLEVQPDIISDFRAMPFVDNTFKLVVFDPPHLRKLGNTSWLAKKYGRLLPTWEDDIKAGFEECMRVLDVYGTLIFKWNQNEIPLSKILPLLSQQPLFGHTSRKNGETVWMAFMKMPIEAGEVQP
ncbi:class I SAM-dependent methyltransferase [Hymenobacter aerilatus]|uniref:Class I SAM-dependent methyltransferase n=1 Tax=Hymenobacter aerilatus TaxID=2932251 RepID=A0A8T9T0N3_9BACT|nr:class I SAM-dependent methyltransferase [Hymenobacter aerilatus]UOR07201.1 class I SAM-dependent methyltransferase [Hymenobacter aerilatus]